MRFKSLPHVAQLAVVDFWMQYVSQAPAELFYPVVPPATWLKALRHLNVRIRAGLLPSVDSFHLATDLVDEWLHGPTPDHGTCSCCGQQW